MTEFNRGQEDMPQAKNIMPEGMTLLWYQQVDSTNQVALHEPGLAEGTIIAADKQLAGRGRLGRVWHSPAGLNLYFSIVMYPKMPRERWGGLSLATGVALAESVVSLGINPALKWPNDLLVEGSKLAGILLEARNKRLVVGIGINVNQVDFPPALNATSFKLAAKGDWRRDRLLSLFAEKVYKHCLLWEQDYQEIIAAWRKYDIVLGRRIRHESIDGVAVDIDSVGQLIVDADDGIRHSLHSGEISLEKFE